MGYRDDVVAPARPLVDAGDLDALLDRVGEARVVMPDAPGDPRAALSAFERWPTWMWADEEVLDFCRWLRAHTLRRDLADRAGLHGLDVYSL